MTNWHGYILLEKPAALTMPQWADVLTALYPIFNKSSDHQQPANRLHYRLSLDNTKVLIEATFHIADLDIQDLNRLAKYIATALGGAYTPAQVRTAMANHITLWRVNQAWALSGDDARAHLAANSAQWEEEPT